MFLLVHYKKIAFKYLNSALNIKCLASVCICLENNTVYKKIEEAHAKARLLHWTPNFFILSSYLRSKTTFLKK